MSDDLWDDDVPWADPQIQADYEWALGRFLVAFNRIESMVSDLIVLAMKRLGRETGIGAALDNGLANRTTFLSARLREIDGMPSIPVDTIIAFCRKRNGLAHGHFEQNPFSGEYEIIGRDKIAERHSPDTIEPLIAEADAILQDLRGVWACFYFEDVDVEDHQP